MRASRAMTTITVAAITVKITVKASPMPNAAPGFRTASNRSRSPMTSIGSWCSSLATTSILLPRSSRYATTATAKRAAILRRPFGRSAGAAASSSTSGVPMMRSASAT